MSMVTKAMGDSTKKLGGKHGFIDGEKTDGLLAG